MEEEKSNFANEIKASVKRIKSKLRLAALLDRAKQEYEKNNYEGCENNCREILQEEPTNAAALRGLGCVMQAHEKFSEAITYYEQALEFSANKEIEYTLIGSVYYLEDNFEEAIKYYNLAININDDYDKAYDGRNQAMLEQHLEILDLQDRLIKQQIF